jgi:hypothetical protein
MNCAQRVKMGQNDNIRQFPIDSVRNNSRGVHQKFWRSGESFCGCSGCITGKLRMLRSLERRTTMQWMPEERGRHLRHRGAMPTGDAVQEGCDTNLQGICRPGTMHDDVMGARGVGEEAFVASRSDASWRCHAGKLRVFRVSGAMHDNAMEARGERRAFVATRIAADGRCLTCEPQIGSCREAACSTPLWVHTRRCHASQGRE